MYMYNYYIINKIKNSRLYIKFDNITNNNK